MSPPSNLYCINSTLNIKKFNPFFFRKGFLISSSSKSIQKKKHRSLSSILQKKEKTKIIWNEGGKEILLTGTFCNWNKFYLMEKDQKDGNFSYTLDLPKGFHQFKFKVDGQWKNSSIYPKINNHGNINNYLDNTSSNNENPNESTVESSLISTNNKNKIINNNANNANNKTKNIIKIKVDYSYSKKNYCNYFPKKNEMREYTDKKPCNFPTECYHGINEIQNKIGNENYLNLKENEIYNGNYSYKNIERKDHILLNHLCHRKKDKNGNLINSITIKYRHKNTTFLYYK